MKCPKCQFNNEEGAKFCNECGHLLEHICPECGKINALGSMFCNKCGQRLEEVVGVAKALSEADSERKYVTVLFSDMSGYTEMSEKLDPEDVKEITSRIFDEISKVVSKYEGFIEKFIGDAVMALFGVPNSHEDDPIRAIRAAREIHEVVSSISPSLEEKIGKPLSMHSGVNTGLVVTGEVDLEKGTHGIAGDTINLASRFSGLAKSGEILVSLDSYRPAEGYFNFEELGPSIIKGKTEPVHVYKVVSPKESPVKIHRISGLRSDLIGRKVEMFNLSDAVEQLVKGKGMIFTICGDAGTGKSRLVEEFKSTLDLKTIQWREGHAYPYCQNIPYFPLINLLSRAFSVEEGDPYEKIKVKVHKGIEYLGGGYEDIIPYIGSLFSLSYPEIDEVSPEFWKSQLQKALREILLALVLQEPTIICFEDLHWADPSSIELIHYLLSEFNYPALFLCTYRPPFNLFTNNQILSLGAAYNEIKLQDLSASEAQDMLESLLKSKTIPKELQRFVQNRLEGNPFYLEETINSLIESDLLIRDNGDWKLSRPIADQDIPSTVHGVLSSRFDRLEKDMKRILQEASVIGRAFLYDILKKISDLRDHCEGCLRDLERLDLIRTKAIKPDIEYIFKHALTQEVVYNGLLKKERKILHEKIGFVMEQLFHDRLPEFYETLAFHFTKSNSVHKAVDYLVKSGEKSLKRYALEESNRYFQKAFELLNAIQDKSMEEKQILIDTIIRWVFVFYYIGDVYKWTELLSSHKKLAESLDDKETIGMFYAWLGFALTCRDKPNEAYQYLLKALKIGEGINNQKVIGYACAWLTWTCAGLGLFREGIKYGKRAQEIAKKFETDHYLFFKSLAGISYNYEFCGDYKKCSEIGKVLIEYGKNHSNVRCLVAGNISMGEVYFISGKLPRAIEFYKKAAEVSADPMYYYWGSLKLGFSYAFNGQIQEAEKVLQEVTSFGTNFGHQMLGHPARTCYGAVLMAKGEMAKGLKLIEKTNENYLETDQKLLQAITEQLLGRIFLQIVEGAGPINLKLIIKNIGFLIRYVPIAAKKAEHHLNNAIRIAKEIGAKGILGQATLDLGLLYKAKKQTDLARKNITGAMEILKQCEAEVLLKQAKETLESLG